jgi:hypothetical protein
MRLRIFLASAPLVAALLVAMTCSWAFASPAADGVLRPAADRFAEATDETPSFQRHVVPLLSRLGCNGRACHGSFQGQGGFRLSLFGYDFAADHASLTAAASDGAPGERRIDKGAPQQSLILKKPTLQVDHEGGERFKPGSWPHRLLQRWIAAGAQGTSSADERRLLRLDVEPNSIVFAATAGEQSVRPLRVVARWEDGSAEDVTCLCRYQANDDTVAAVDVDGRVTSVGKGDTHVIVFYDNEVTAVPVLRPVSDLTGDRYPEVPTPTRIDELVAVKLRTLGIVPAEICDDATFLRRASLDACGTLPTTAEVETFLASSAVDKRIKKIDELLARPAYAAWWANKLCDFTGNSPQRQSELGSKLAIQWYHWVHDRVRDNVPYDTLVAGMVTAGGRDGDESYREYAQAMTDLVTDERLAEYAGRRSLPHFWTRQNVKTPEEKGLAFAYSFLGIRLHCAQCHKHPFDRWSQDDFKRFAGLFERVKYGVPPDAADEYGKLAAAVGATLRGTEGATITPDVLARGQGGKTLPWRQLYIEKKSGPPTRLTVLGDEAISIAADEDPREKLMAWLRRRDNPYFARAFVNRVWANYFHVGLIDPPDDANPANPPSNAELSAWLTEDFIAGGYDMRRLHRTIMASDAYQRSWRPNETNAGDRRHYSRAVPRRLPAEVVYDAVAQVTASDERAEQVRGDLERRAIGHLSTLMAGTYAMNVFGKPERTTNCDCERTTDATLLQAVFMQNDPLVRQRLDDSGWLADANKRLGGAEGDSARVTSAAVVERRRLVREAYLRTVGREPTAGDAARAEKYFSEASTGTEALYDLLWALLNSKEFLLNH